MKQLAQHLDVAKGIQELQTLAENDGWICTDIDELQFRKDLGDGVYTFKQLGRQAAKDKIFEAEMIHPEAIWNSTGWAIMDIDVRNSTPEEIENCTELYYPKGENLDEAIIAECIFEMSIDPE